MQIVSTIKEIVKLNPFFKEQLQTFLDQVRHTNGICMIMKPIAC